VVISLSINLVKLTEVDLQQWYAAYISGRREYGLYFLWRNESQLELRSLWIKEFRTMDSNKNHMNFFVMEIPLKIYMNIKMNLLWYLGQTFVFKILWSIQATAFAYSGTFMSECLVSHIISNKRYNHKNHMSFLWNDSVPRKFI
jgi:hypothetical protein